MSIIDYMAHNMWGAPDEIAAAFDAASEGCDAALAVTLDRDERLRIMTETLLRGWALLDESKDARRLFADAVDDREHGIATSDGWTLSAGGLEDFKLQGEGVLDGHAVVYVGYGTIQTNVPHWMVGIADLGAGSAVRVGWSAGGTSGWLVAGDETDDPSLPKVTTREGAWTRMEQVVAAFRAGDLTRFEPELDTDRALERRVIADIFGPLMPEGWLDIPHAVLAGRTPVAALLAGEYTQVNALVLAEREEISCGG